MCVCVCVPETERAGGGKGRGVRERGDGRWERRLRGERGPSHLQGRRRWAGVCPIRRRPPSWHQLLARRQPVPSDMKERSIYVLSGSQHTYPIVGASARRRRERESERGPAVSPSNLLLLPSTCSLSHTPPSTELPAPPRHRSAPPRRRAPPWTPRPPPPGRHRTRPQFH